MKNSKKLFILVEVILGVMVIWLMLFTVWSGKRGNGLKVSVIVQNPDSKEWSAFKYGIKMAAQEQDVEVSVVSTGEMLTSEAQKRVIEQEISKGVDAIIVQPVPRKEAKEMLMKKAGEIPLMLIEHVTDTTQEGRKDISVEPNHPGLGEALALEAIKDYHGVLRGKSVGIFSKSTNYESTLKRAGSTIEKLERAGAKLKWFVSGDFTESSDAFLEAQPKVDIILAMDDRSVVRLGEYAVSHPLGDVSVYGIGHSTEAVYYLDTGVIECLLVPDEFSIGYKSLIAAVEKIRKNSYDIQENEIFYTPLRKETLFYEDNQKILFTMSQ